MVRMRVVVVFVVVVIVLCEITGQTDSLTLFSIAVHLTATSVAQIKVEAFMPSVLNRIELSTIFSVKTFIWVL